MRSGTRPAMGKCTTSRCASKGPNKLMHQTAKGSAFLTVSATGPTVLLAASPLPRALAAGDAQRSTG